MGRRGRRVSFGCGAAFRSGQHPSRNTLWIEEAATTGGGGRAEQTRAQDEREIYASFKSDSNMFYAPIQDT